MADVYTSEGKGIEALADILYPTLDEKVFTKQMIEVRNEEVRHITDYLNRFVIGKYIAKLKTKCELKTTPEDLKNMFVFDKTFNLKNMKANNFEQDSFEEIMTIKFPHPDSAALRSLYSAYRKETSQSYFEPIFWEEKIKIIYSLNKSNLMPYLDYYFKILCLVDVLTTLGDSYVLKTIYKSLRKPKIDEALSNYVYLGFKPNFDTKALGGYRSFINLFTLNKEVKYGFRLRKKINIK